MTLDEFDFGISLISIVFTSKIGANHVGNFIILQFPAVFQSFFSAPLFCKIKPMKTITDKIEIRKATATDAKLISVLGTVSFYEAYFEQDNTHDLANYIHESFEMEKIRAEIADKNVAFFIIYLNEKAVGYAKMREDSKIDCITNENSIELQRIYTIERVYSRGIGEHLLKHCLEIAKTRGFETLWLGVWEENKRAQKFYAKHGFKRVGELNYPYGESVGINFVLEKIL